MGWLGEKWAKEYQGRRKANVNLYALIAPVMELPTVSLFHCPQLVILPFNRLDYITQRTRPMDELPSSSWVNLPTHSISRCPLSLLPYFPGQRSRLHNPRKTHHWLTFLVAPKQLANRPSLSCVTQQVSYATEHLRNPKGTLTKRRDLLWAKCLGNSKQYVASRKLITVGTLWRMPRWKWLHGVGWYHAGKQFSKLHKLTKCQTCFQPVTHQCHMITKIHKHPKCIHACTVYGEANS